MAAVHGGNPPPGAVPPNPAVTSPFLLPRATGRRTSMGAFAPQWAQQAGVTSPMTSEAEPCPRSPPEALAPEDSPSAAATISPAFQSRTSSEQNRSSLDSLIAAVLSRGPVLNQGQGRGAMEEANGNRLSPVRDFPKSPNPISSAHVFKALPGGVQSPTGGLKPEVLKMLLSKPLNPGPNRSVMQNRLVGGKRPNPSTLNRVNATSNAQVLTASVALERRDLLPTQSYSNPSSSLPFKKRAQSNNSGSPPSITRSAPLELPSSYSLQGVHSPSLPETKASQSSSLDTNPSDGLLTVAKASSDTSSQSVSPGPRLITQKRTVVTQNLAQKRSPQAERVETLQQLEQKIEANVKTASETKREETDVLRAMLAARERELEAVRRERDAIQLMACTTKSLLERKEGVIEALRERVAVLESQAGATESEEIALAALAHLQEGGEEQSRVARFAVARKPRTPSVLLGGNEMQRIRSFSPLRRSFTKSNGWNTSEGNATGNLVKNGGLLDESSKAEYGRARKSSQGGRMSEAPSKHVSDSTEELFEKGDAHSDVLAALMSLQGPNTALPPKAESESSGEARLPKREEKFDGIRNRVPLRGGEMADSESEGSRKRRKLVALNSFPPVDDDPSEVMASPILLRLPGRFDGSSRNRPRFDGRFESFVSRNPGYSDQRRT
jgi:hypothetical protein